MKNAQMTLAEMIEEIEVIQPVLRFGRGRLAEFKEVLESMEVDLITMNTQVLWNRTLDSLIALKGNLSATQAVINVWQEKIRIFRRELNGLVQRFTLPDGICPQEVLRARDGLADLTSEILRQREMLREQVSCLEEQMQLLEKQRGKVRAPLRAAQAPRLKAYMYARGDERIEASIF